MPSTPNISIIFPVKNEGSNVKETIDSLFTVQSHYNFEVIVIDDASTDECCDFLQSYQNKEIIVYQTEGIGAANARNLGADRAGGEILFFCDAHLQFEDWWLDRLIKPLLTKQSDAVSPAIGSIENPNFIGYGQTLKFNLRIQWNNRQGQLFEIPILPGACFGISRAVFEDIGGFETGFRKWGYEDVELSLKLWLFGYKCHCEPSAKILHLFRTVQPYQISYYDIYYNLLRMAYSHFNGERLRKCKKLLIHEKAEQIEKEVIKNNVNKQRKYYFKKRKYSDDWFFTKFNINF